MSKRTHFERLPLREIGKNVKRAVDIDTAKIYKTLGCHLYGRGVYQRDARSGAEIKAQRMFLVEENDLVIDRIWAQKGSVGIVPADIAGSVVTQDFPVYALDVSRVLPEYIAWYVKTDDFWEECRRHSYGTSGRQRLSPGEIPNISFPICDLSEQHRIVHKISEIMRRFDDIKELRNGLVKEARNRHCQLGEARIKSTSEADIFMRAIRNEIFTIENPIGPIVSIEKSGLVLNKETTNPEIANPTGDFLYLDISGVEGVTGRILELKKYKGCNAPSRARRVMRTRDVVISTVRPYLRSFTIVPADLDNQICSTGFAVFTCPPEIDPYFLLHQFLSDFFVEQCIQKMQGGHYPAINVSKLRACQIFVPSREKQQTITAFLDPLQVKATALRKLQMETEREIEQLVPKILNKAFKGEL